MNRGSANKLIECIESGRYKVGSGQLRFDDCFCVFGVMLDFLDPTAWKPAYIGYTWKGETFKMPVDARKVIKMKTMYGDFVTANGLKLCLSDIGHNSWDQPLYYLKQYYDQL